VASTSASPCGSRDRNADTGGKALERVPAGMAVERSIDRRQADTGDRSILAFNRSAS
jgi:hypothetical protein